MSHSTQLLVPSRRGFLAGLGAFALAAPAIVKAASLMPVKSVDAVSLRKLTEYSLIDDLPITRMDVLYGSMQVRPEWTTGQQIITRQQSGMYDLDEFSERIMRPMIDQIQQAVADAVMNGSNGSLFGSPLG